MSARLSRKNKGHWASERCGAVPVVGAGVGAASSDGASRYYYYRAVCLAFGEFTCLLLPRLRRGGNRPASLAVDRHRFFTLLWCVPLAALLLVRLASAQESPHSRLVFDRVAFAPASAELSAEARWKLMQNVRAMEIYGDVVVWIEGHAAAHEGGVDPLELGDRRARAVAAAFTAAGVDPERIAGPVSFGAEKPLKRDNARRVEMREK